MGCNEDDAMRTKVTNMRSGVVPTWTSLSPCAMRTLCTARGRRTALCPLPLARPCRPAAHPDGSGRRAEGGEAAHSHAQRHAQRSAALRQRSAQRSAPRSAQHAAEHEAERPGGGGERDARRRRPARRSLRRAEQPGQLGAAPLGGGRRARRAWLGLGLGLGSGLGLGLGLGLESWGWG